MNRMSVTRVLLATTLVVAACDTGDPSDPMPRQEAKGTVAPPQSLGDLESISRTVPEFGGLYVNEQGQTVVYVTDLRQTERVKRVLSGVEGVTGDVVVVQAAHRFNDLSEHYNRSWTAALEVPGAVFSDLDEANNRILFGVEHAGAANAVRGVAARLGVPASMVEVQVVEPIQQLATLRDNVNPKVGGLQIHFTQYLCTLGFNVLFGTTQAFITNSHCTATQGGVENTVYYQPTSSVAPSPIATEVADPLYWKGGICPKGKKCRYSDSSRANYNVGVLVQQGGIAATSGSNLTITGTHLITNEIDNTSTPVAVGGTVSKTGRTTGTSTGRVTNTCVNTGVQGSQIMQLCQTFVSASVGSGDSGSPVYSGSGNVSLVGILWGGSSTSFVFSPLKNIKDELGAFTAR